VHALGFQSLIGPSGLSNFGIVNNYYSRYDQFLIDANANALITPTIASLCPPNYLSYNFSAATASIVLGVNGCTNIPADVTTFSTAVKYASPTTTAVVYNPLCFESASSLSHFEDICTFGNFTTTCVPTTTPGYNNLYVAMANATSAGPCYVKRYLKEEEKNVLCDLGYSVKMTYTSNAAGATHTYAAACSPLNVIGINDGFVDKMRLKYF